MKYVIRFCTACCWICLGGLLYFDSTYQGTLTSRPDPRSGHVVPFNKMYYTSEQVETLRDFVMSGMALLVLTAYLKKREDDAERK